METLPLGYRSWERTLRAVELVKSRLLRATAALDEAGQNAWCREHGLYPSELERWKQGATEALADPGEARASHGETRADRKRIKELERELLRKDKALAETAALLVLSKKLSAIFPGGADE